MNHQPFRDWLLSEENLTAEQNQQMHEHLLSCESCRQTNAAWLEVETAFRKSPQVIPAPGFTNRWQENLFKYKETKQKRIGWITIGFVGIITIIILGLLISQGLTLIQTPGPYLAEWLTRIFNLIAVFLTLQGMFHSFSGTIPLFIVWLFFLVGFVSFISVLWLATYRKFSLARRIV